MLKDIDGERVREVLQAAHDKGEAEAEEWHTAQEQGYIPGYFNALIEVAHGLGYAYYYDRATRKTSVKPNKR